MCVYLYLKIWKHLEIQYKKKIFFFYKTRFCIGQVQFKRTCEQDDVSLFSSKCKGKKIKRKTEQVVVYFYIMMGLFQFILYFRFIYYVSIINYSVSGLMNRINLTIVTYILESHSIFHIHKMRRKKCIYYIDIRHTQSSFERSKSIHLAWMQW